MTINWHEIRNKSGIHDLGNGECKKWCIEALANEEVASTYSACVSVLNSLGATVFEEHWFLFDGKNVGDGTCGQYDHDYPLGYYGPISEAPDKLRVIYKKGRSI